MSAGRTSCPPSSPSGGPAERARRRSDPHRGREHSSVTGTAGEIGGGFADKFRGLLRSVSGAIRLLAVGSSRYCDHEGRDGDEGQPHHQGRDATTWLWFVAHRLLLWRRHPTPRGSALLVHRGAVLSDQRSMTLMGRGVPPTPVGGTLSSVETSSGVGLAISHETEREAFRTARPPHRGSPRHALRCVHSSSGAPAVRRVAGTPAPTSPVVNAVG